MDADTQMRLIYFVVGGLLLIAILFITRELNCWYLKINERLELQKRTNELLEELIVVNRLMLSEDEEITQNQLNQSDVNNPEYLDELVSKIDKKE